MTVEQLIAERDSLLATLAKPAQVTGDGTGSVVFRPTADLEAALRRVDAEIARLQGSEARVFVVQTSRGI